MQTGANPSRRRVVGQWCLVLLGVAALAWIVVRGWNNATYSHADFYDFYWGADAARRGTDMYSAGDGGYIYPPLLGVLMIPMTFLSPQPAMKVWVVMCGVLLVWCVWRSVRIACEAFDFKTTRLGEWTLAALTLLVLADSFRGEFEWANSNIVMLGGIVLGFAWLRKKPALAGAAIAFACAIKYLPFVLLPYFLIRRQWRAAGGMVLGLAACVILPALWLGWEKNAAYLATALRGMGVMSGATDASRPAAHVMSITIKYSLSITSGIARMLGEDRTINSLVLFSALAFGVVAFVAYVMYWRMSVELFTLRVLRTRWHVLRTTGVAARWREMSVPGSLLLAEASAVFASALAFGPQTQKRHFNLLLPLVAGLVVMLVKHAFNLPNRIFVACGAAVLLLIAGVTPMPNLPGVRGFIEYPWKFFGGPGWLTMVVSLTLVWSVLATLPKEPAASR